MKEPTTPEEVKVLHNLLRSDPQHYLQIVNKWIADNPANSHAYFDRHFAWPELGEPRRGLDDLTVSIQLNPRAVAFWSRGEVYRRILGNTKKPSRTTRTPRRWIRPNGQDNGFCLLYQADCHARLGNEAAALACCARLRDDFWTPGMNNTPSGGKAEIAEKLRRVAADARGRRV